MSFAIYKIDLGLIKIEEENEKVILIKKVDKESITNFGTKTDLTNKVFTQILEYFNGERKVFDFPYEMRGTDFQKRVWNALCSIPYGETRTYKGIAITVGNVKASRAVGMANNKNPIMIAVPCHRVIGSNGKLVGYAGGTYMKEYMLNIEDKNS